MLKHNSSRTMPLFFTIITMFLFASCNCGHKQKDNKPTQANDISNIDKEKKNYTDQQLEYFLDKIGNLSQIHLAKEVSFFADSTFKNQIQLNEVISQSDFSKLKQAINQADEIDRTIDIQTAKSIFGEFKVDSAWIEDGGIPFTFYSFDKRKDEFNEYAICLGNPNMTWDCVLYFFKNNTIIAKHNIFHRYGLELEHYKDIDGKTIIYYRENFGSGTGIWQFNYFFYKYYDDTLIPILNELQNGNLNSWGVRNFWLKADVVNTNPLTLKMVYYQELDGNDDFGYYKILEDSTFVQYIWDEKSKTLLGNYEKSKINNFQILTYYLQSDELLFINTYYPILKSMLKDKTKRNIVLNYLNEVANSY